MMKFSIYLNRRVFVMICGQRRPEHGPSQIACEIIGYCIIIIGTATTTCTQMYMYMYRKIPTSDYSLNVHKLGALRNFWGECLQSSHRIQTQKFP